MPGSKHANHGANKEIHLFWKNTHLPLKFQFKAAGTRLNVMKQRRRNDFKPGS